MQSVCNFAVALALAGCWGLPASAFASSLIPDCQPAPATTAVQQDRLLRVAGLLKQELESSLGAVALISRSGLDLARLGQRYSHGGLSLRENANGPWSVRQLYFSCEERKPRLFDQGLAGFVLGADNPDLGFVSLLFLPEDAANALESVALDNAASLSMLAPDYSANAYAFSTLYQNCNQWLVELMARAWGAAHTRHAAQAWLRNQGYRATSIVVSNPFIHWLAGFSPWLRQDDHPAEELKASRFLVSMPASIESFLQTKFPQTRRVEFCHNERHVVIRRNGEALSPQCSSGPGDTVIAWD